MRTRKLTRRNYKQDNGQRRKQKEEGSEIYEPTKTKDGKGYRFAIKSDITIEKWIQLFTIRYWHQQLHSFME